MNLLRIIPSMDPKGGGPCQGIRNNTPELEKFNIFCEIATTDISQTWADDGLTVHTLGEKKNAWSYSSKLIPWLIKNIPRFDAIIIHGLWQYHSFAVYSAIKKLERKKISTPKVYVMPHGMLDPYFQRDPSRRLKAIRNWVYWLLIEKQVVNNADAILFTCETELLLARETFPLYKPKEELNIGYGIIAPPLFKDQMKADFLEKTQGEFPYFLFISRIHQKKGVDLLLLAYNQLLNENKDNTDNIPALVIAGPGIDTSFGQSLLKIIEDFPLLELKVYVVGMLTGDAKWGAFYGCEVFVLPSHQENFGIVVAEALACGKPVLISDQVNIWREIEDANAGIIGKDTLEGTYSMLKQWLTTPIEEKQQIESNTRLCFEKKFSISPNAKRFVDVLKNINE